MRLGRNLTASEALPRLHPFGDMAVSKEPTYEDAKEIVEKHDEAVNPKGLRQETNQASGVIMKANPVDPSILTYDPKDVEYDEEVRKQAEKARKDEDKK